MSIKYYIIIVFLILLIAIQYLYSKCQRLTEENTLQKEQIEMLELSNKQIADINIKIQKTNSKLQKEQKTLLNKLSKFEIQANKISSKHPKMLEKRINNASNEVNKCLENISKNLPCD